MTASCAWNGCVTSAVKYLLALALTLAGLTTPLTAADLLEETTRNMALDDMSSALAAKERGQAATAIRRFSYVLEYGNLDDENRAIALNNRGNCYADLGKLDLALPDYDLALSLYPGFTEAYFNRAMLYYQSGRYTSALEDFQKAARLNPGLPQIPYNMSFALARLGRLDEAEEAVRQAIALSPDNRKYREQLAQWQEENK
jgi:tetratricopeptide (TPR) repeat protein